MTFTEQQIRDLWAKIDVRGPGDCWLWTGGRNSSGYGAKRLTIAGRQRSLLAHRMVWLVLNSDIPEGLVVCHKCDVKTCCNPSHLFLGTHKDNTRDMMAKGRGLQGVLDQPQTDLIHELREAGMSLRAIATQLGVSTYPVRRVLREPLQSEMN